MIATRFAPSPTGRLHLGHAYSAARAFDLAREGGGRFLLRIEDIDATRSRPEHLAAILDDLAWLGLEWDAEPWLQSQRLPAHAAALDRLRAMDLLYPCFCTRSELAASASAPHGGIAPVYPGTCRTRGRADLDRPHCWRIDMARAIAVAGPLTWHDAEAGEVAARPDLHGDVVLARKDAPTSYHLAVVVDDAAQGITDVVRGIDLFESTHVHRLLQALLGLPVPAYHHHRLVADASGERLAKRRGSESLGHLRAAGADPRKLLEGLRNDRLPVGFAFANA